MKKVVSILLFATMILCFYGCSKENKKYSDISFKVLEATNGYNEDEEAVNLFDFDADTKWRVLNFDKATLVFEASEPILINGYTIVTCNNSTDYNCCSIPVDWELYGSNDNETWVVLDEKDDCTEIPEKNKTKCDFIISDIEDEYKYFKLKITDTKYTIKESKYGDFMQISEFSLNYNGADYTYSNLSDTESESDKLEKIEPNYSGLPQQEETEPTSETTLNKGTYLGTKSISNGAEYKLGIGDSITITNPRRDAGLYSAYNWFADVSDGGISIEKNGSSCKITANKVGKYEITATLDYYVSGVGNKDFTDKFTIIVTKESQGSTTSSDSSSSSYSSSSSGSSYYGSYYTPSYETTTRTCLTCKGAGEYLCTSCNGVGYKIKYGSTPNYAGTIGGSKTYTYEEDCPFCTNGKRKCYCGS